LNGAMIRKLSTKGEGMWLAAGRNHGLSGVGSNPPDTPRGKGYDQNG